MPSRPRIQAIKPCSHRASGAIIAPTITCALAKSATVRAAIAATTRTPSQSLRSIGSSGDCGGNSSRRILSARVALPLPAVLCAIALAVWAARDPPRSARYESAAGRRSPTVRSPTHPLRMRFVGVLYLLLDLGFSFTGTSSWLGHRSPRWC